MSQVTSVFITVTATVTGSSFPTLNSTQIHRLNASKQTGQIVALVALGMFILLALLLLLCWGILFSRRPRPVHMVENMDAVRHGRGAFLPMIGRGKRKSDTGLEAARGGGSEGSNSRQSLLRHETKPKGRRLSMWADDTSPCTGAIPSPPVRPLHSRSSSGGSVERLARYNHHRSVSNASSISTYSMLPEQQYAYGAPYNNQGSVMDNIALGDPPMMPPAVPPKIGRYDGRATSAGVTRYGFEDREVSPVVSPIDDVQLGITRYSQHARGHMYDRGMHA